MHKSRATYFGGFTLIELMIVITILGIITLSSYIPYAHHQKKILLQQWAREISQSLRDARSLAINGLNTWSWNVNVAVLFSSGANSVEYYVYPYGDFLDISNMSAWELYREKFLPKGISIDSINGVAQDTLFTFEAISWSWTIGPFTATGELDIQISFMWSPEAVLQKHITYYTQSYISDY